MLSQQQASGFHILELTSTLACIALLAAFTYPSIQSLSTRHRLRSETRRFASALEKIAVEAIQRELTISIQLSSHGYSVLRPGRADAAVFADPIQAAFEQDSDSQLEFYPSGAATPASISLKNGNKECVVKISIRGRVASECR
ncbi:MAG: GspH/FimT family pseudopilin [Deltaproteobacteria bacterium]|nr:GspH/FimT family pseudopilin [Deltaproteobacteria bacterium]